MEGNVRTPGALRSAKTSEAVKTPDRTSREQTSSRREPRRYQMVSYRGVWYLPGTTEAEREEIRQHYSSGTDALRSDGAAEDAMVTKESDE